MTIEEVRQLFTKNGNTVELNLDLLNVNCINSNNNAFSLDDQGNLATHSLTTELGEINANIASTVLNLVYPVGSIYISVSSTNPSTFIGGTWQSFGTGRTLVGVDTSQTEFNTVQKTGGSKYMQAHTHRKNSIGWVNSGGFWVGSGNYTTLYFDSDSNQTGGANVTTGNSGNLQPYITVYMWKRIS